MTGKPWGATVGAAGPNLHHQLHQHTQQQQGQVLPPGTELGIRLQKMGIGEREGPQFEGVGAAKVKLLQLLGQGAFADVYKAELCFYQLLPTAGPAPWGTSPHPQVVAVKVTRRRKVPHGCEGEFMHRAKLHL